MIESPNKPFLGASLTSSGEIKDDSTTSTIGASASTRVSIDITESDKREGNYAT